MSQDDALLEKDAPPDALGLAVFDHAPRIVRLLQCPRCAHLFRTPVTLPCGRSLCRLCLPETHTRPHVSYPLAPDRRLAFACPFPACRLDHPASDCSVNVVLTRLIEAVSAIVAASASLTELEPTIMRDDHERNYEAGSKGKPEGEHDAGIASAHFSLENDGEKTAGSRSTHNHTPIIRHAGGRVVATFLLAAQGGLQRGDSDYLYQNDRLDAERQKSIDADILREIVDATQRECDCQVCYGLMLDPVTTSCGHTLCRKCLARVLDHSLHCPVCRRDLAIPPTLRGQPSNGTLVALFNGLCPELVAARAEAVAQEELGPDGHSNVPLFVCTLGFPTQPTFLRIFEPRYRLMLRRAIEGNRQFGMLMYNRYGEPQGDLGTVHFYQYGTMLEIVNAQAMPDGTSLIETRGLYRFRILSHGSLDGYAIGNVERIDDVDLTEEERIEADEISRAATSSSSTDRPVDDEGNDLDGQPRHDGENDAENDSEEARTDRMSTQDLLAFGHEFVAKMQARSANWLQQRVLDIYGQPPDDAALFPYWFASVLPISDDEKYKLLGTRTVRERMKIIAGWIRRIESQRWYQSNSCRIL